MLTVVATALRGFAMGSADVVPGVSGGTVAYILGIYPRLLGAISGLGAGTLRLLYRGQWRTLWYRHDLGFLITLGVGLFGALLFFTRVVPIPQLLRDHPQPVYGLFFGLIVGSLLLLTRELGRHRGVDLLWMGLGTLVGLLLVNLVPLETPKTALFVFVSGAIAITAMILPGVSGSFILLILHQYEHVFGALGSFRLQVIGPFAAGCLVGVLLFSRLLGWLLSRFPRVTGLVINGLLLGSLWAVWPFQQREYVLVREKLRPISSQPAWPDTFDSDVLLTFALLLAGLILVAVLGQVARVRSES